MPAAAQRQVTLNTLLPIQAWQFTTPTEPQTAHLALPVCQHTGGLCQLIARTCQLLLSCLQLLRLGADQRLCSCQVAGQLGAAGLGLTQQGLRGRQSTCVLHPPAYKLLVSHDGWESDIKTTPARDQPTTTPVR
eukprot:1159607-Pelagomonas_calceolata.AAC.6